jgi:hypothetical protein
MLTKFRCPSCARVFETSYGIGHAVACPACEQHFTLSEDTLAKPNATAEILARICIVLGYVLFVAVPLIITIRFVMNKADEQGQEQAERPRFEKQPEQREPPVERPKGPKPKKPRPKEPEEPPPIVVVPTNPKEDDPKKPEPPTPPETEIAEVELEIAPWPQVVGWRPKLRDYQSPWQTVGAVDYRVSGSAVTKVPLLRGKDEIVLSASEKLVFVIEVRLNNLAKKREYQPWSHGINHYATAFLIPNGDLDWVKTPLGTRFHSGLPGKRALPVDGRSLRDFAVFELPPANVTEIKLRLEADRFGEFGDLWIVIPKSAWTE